MIYPSDINLCLMTPIRGGLTYSDIKDIATNNFGIDTEHKVKSQLCKEIQDKLNAYHTNTNINNDTNDTNNDTNINTDKINIDKINIDDELDNKLYDNIHDIIDDSIDNIIDDNNFFDIFDNNNADNADNAD